MTTLEKIRAEIEKHTDGNNHCDEYLDGYNNGMKDALEIIDRYADQEPTTRQSCDNCKQDRKECGNDDHYGFCQNWEYAEQEPTIPCDLCGFNMDEVCEYLSVCPAIGKAVSE